MKPHFKMPGSNFWGICCLILILTSADKAAIAASGLIFLLTSFVVWEKEVTE